jgi:hypothetical protein
MPIIPKFQMNTFSNLYSRTIVADGGYQSFVNAGADATLYSYTISPQEMRGNNIKAVDISVSTTGYQSAGAARTYTLRCIIDGKQITNTYSTLALAVPGNSASFQWTTTIFPAGRPVTVVVKLDAGAGDAWTRTNFTINLNTRTE